jgi:hypothetical protein
MERLKRVLVEENGGHEREKARVRGSTTEVGFGGVRIGGAG